MDSSKRGSNSRDPFSKLSSSGSKMKPFPLRKRDDGVYTSKYLGGEDILVELTGDGTWDIYKDGPTDALGLWRHRPSEKRIPRKGLLGWLGFKQWVPVDSKSPIRSSEVRELHFLNDDALGKHSYRDVQLPPPAVSKSWQATHYDVTMRFDKGCREVESKAVIKGVGKASSDELQLDFSSFPGTLQVGSVKGEQARFERKDDRVVVYYPLQAREEFNLELQYKGRPRPMSHPAVPADLGWLQSESSVVTFNGVDRSSSWLPGDDDPANKATYTFHIEVPSGYFAVANGKLLNIVESPRSRIYHYGSRFPMASYLASVNVFDKKEYTITELFPDFTVVHPHGMESQVRQDFANHPRMMAFLTERLGPYPFDVYGAIVAQLSADTYHSRFSDGQNTFEADVAYQIAFEAQTRPIFPRQSIKGRGDFEPTIIHELAHQWFGNAVTKATEQDIWVNEAFPTYCGSLWTEELFGSEAFAIEIDSLYERIEGYQFSDTMAAPDRQKIFSQENYARMALSMHALRLALGDQRFYGTLAGVVETHKYKSITVRQMLETMNALNQGHLSDLFDMWLFSRTVPRL